MQADIAHCDSAKNGIGDGMKADICVAMTGQAARMFDFDPAEPKFLAIGQLVNIVAHAGAYLWKRAHEISRECQFVQRLVTFDQCDGPAIRPQDLRVVPSIRISSPCAVRRGDGIVSKRLRCLDPPKDITVRAAGHDAFFRYGETVDHGKHRDCAGMTVKSGKQAFYYLHWNDRARCIMNQDVLVRMTGQGIQRICDGLLARLAARDECDATVFDRCLPCDFVSAVRYRNQNTARTAFEKGVDRVPQDRLALPDGELLGEGLSRPKPFARGYDYYREGG